MSGGIAIAADFAIIIVAATLIGLVARQLGQPTIVAYIATGVILGPVVLDIVVAEGLVDDMAELGLGFLLFLLGLKMRIDDIREILRPVTNIAIGQTVLQTALAFFIAWWLGFGTVEVVVIALATVFGATPIIVKILTDKDEITSLPGKIDVGVLIVQDIYLVVILALFAAEELTNPAEIATQLGIIFVMMTFIGIFSIASSRYLLPDLFRRIADDKDVFLIIAIAWAFLFIAIAEGFELSVEVGAFLAGLSLAQLSYSVELEDRITPITDFFILIFFASIGLQIESVGTLLEYWQEAIIASLVLMIGNFWIMFYLIDREGFDPETSFIGSINMVQVSEFSLVVGALALTQGYIQEEILGYLTLMALMTMTVSTYIIAYNHQIYERLEPWVQRIGGKTDRTESLEYHSNHAVAIGYDEITEGTLSVLADAFTNVVVIDRRTDHIDALEADDRYHAIFGDFRHTEVRKAAQLSTARFVLSSSVEVEVNLALLNEVSEGTTVFVEAASASDAAELYEAGADYVIMPTNLTADTLTEYLRLFFRNRSEFDRAIERDTTLLRERAASRLQSQHEMSGDTA